MYTPKSIIVKTLAVELRGCQLAIEYDIVKSQ